MRARSQSRFERFIGIDWSGARGPRVKNLKVAVCNSGESAPGLVLPPKGDNWRRDEVIEWIIREANQRCILVGVDFAFSYPYCDQNAYFPGHPHGPESAQALWQAVEAICQAEPNFYGGPF